MNGFKLDLVNKLIRKYKNKLSGSSTSQSINNQNIILLSYVPAITKGVVKSLHKPGFKVIPGIKLGHTLGAPKDKSEI